MLKRGRNAARRFTLPHISVPSRKSLIVAGSIVIALAAVGSAFALIPAQSPKQPPDALPQSAVNQASGFTLYYFKPNFTSNFNLEAGTVDYQDNVLEFGMEDSAGNTLAFTEEAIPPGFDTSTLKADAVYNNEYGHAYISDLVDRTTGALFTNDGTWILINAPKPIGADAMRSIVDNLAPDKN